MSFNISLSGLNAAQKSLDVTSNNIANVATTGFKKSRAEFSDVYSNSVMSNAKTAVGSGVQTASVAQQFSQGSIEGTSNTLDLAISGEGFFVLSAGSGDATKLYTRAGFFETDDVGHVVTPAGYSLMAYPVNEDGSVSSMSLDSTQPLQIPSSAGDPTATSKIEANLILNASAGNLYEIVKDPDTGVEKKVYPAIDRNNPETYTASTSVTVYDSLGNTHSVTYYFAKRGETDDGTGQVRWDMQVYMDDMENPIKMESDELDDQGNPKLTDTVTFLYQGSKCVSQSPNKIKTQELGEIYEKLGVEGVDKTQQIELQFPNIKQVALTSNMQVDRLNQNGFAVGQLTGLQIGGNGLVRATYSNGKTVNLGMIAMAKFTNNQGLAQVGDTCWKETLESGEVMPTTAGSGTTGSIKSSSLESSNVDLAASLVELISAQRNYQANTKALEAASNIMQAILNVS